MQHFYPLLWVLFTYVLLGYVFPFVTTLFQLLRLEMGRVKITRIDLATPLSPLHQSATDEVKALGFTPFAVYTTHDSYDEWQCVMLRHETLPAVANIYLRANSFTPFPVWFWSFGVDSKMLLTANRSPLLLDMRDVQNGDNYAPNLAGQWAAHQARMSGAVLQTLAPEAAFERIVATTMDYPDYNLSAKNFVARGEKFFLSFRTALGMAIAVMRQRRVLRLPFQSSAYTDAHRSAFFAELYEVHNATKKRLKNRPSVSAVLLLLSFIVSLALFTWWLDWKTALAVVIVLLVHECGHAVAMRLFGYRDLNMFFIPMMGAVVTGNVKNIPVWKQAIVLLAGPVPGLLFGIAVALNIHAFAPGSFITVLGLNAAFLNAFNLLPLSFLDGGKLLEITLLSRWPYALFAFALLSALCLLGVMIYLKSYNLFFIVAIFLIASRLLWRIAKVRSALKDSPTQNLRDIFALTEKTIGAKSFNRQFYIVRSIHEQPSVRPARTWEMVGVPLMFLACWGVSGLAWSGWNHDRKLEAAYDAAVNDYYKHYKQGPDKVLAAAQNLSPDDPRRIDAMVIDAFRLKDDARDAALLKVLELQREGRSYRRPVMVERYLNDAFMREDRLNVPDRISVLEAALAKIDAIAPDMYVHTIATRLRIAELRDRAGQVDAAEADLTALLASTARDKEYGYAQRQVAEAQVWFFLDKGRTDDALRFLETAPYAAMTTESGNVGVAKAWALLEAGKTAEAVTQMNIAAPATDDSDDDMAENLDLLYAYWKTGDTARAAALVHDSMRKSYCDAEELSYDLSDELWHRKRSEGIRAATTAVCATLPPLQKKQP